MYVILNKHIIQHIRDNELLTLATSAGTRIILKTA